MPIAIEVRSNKLPGMGERMLSEVAQVVAAAALNCQSLAKVLAPPRPGGNKTSGNLKRSIGAEPENAEKTVWVVGTNVEYAARIEFGFNDTDSLGRRYHQAPQPYLTPAAEQIRPRFIADLERVVKEIAS